MDPELLSKIMKFQEKFEKYDLSICPQDENIILTQFGVTLYTRVFSKIVPNFQRLTINKSIENNNNTTITDIKYLKNPPEECVTKYNRANLKRQSVLYGTFLLPTALNENNPDIGDLFTISYWELKNENNPLLIYPVIDFFKTRNLQLKQVFIESIKDFPENVKDEIIRDSCIIASYFKKYVEKGKEINYTFSAHIANKIFNEIYNGDVEAIIYPSVKDGTDADNIVIKPDAFNSKYKLAKVSENIVDTKKSGVIIFHELKTTNKFDKKILMWN